MIIAGSNWYMAAMMHVLFLKKHHEIDEVLSTGQPPEAWHKQYNKKLARLKKHGASSQKILRLTRIQQKRNMAGLEHLACYVKKTNLVENEYARSSVLSQLEQCRQQCRLVGFSSQMVGARDTCPPMRPDQEEMQNGV
jgi:hypothetical protein